MGRQDRGGSGPPRRTANLRTGGDDVGPSGDPFRRRSTTEVELRACEMTITPMDHDEDDRYDGVTTGIGAITALHSVEDADIQTLV